LSDRSLIDSSARAVYKKANAHSFNGRIVRKADPELHRRRRDAILEAAISCFVRKGFHQSSMQDLAGAADVSMGLLYRYFTNKEAIILAAAQREQADAVAIIANIAEGGDVVESWINALLRLVAFSVDPEQSRLLNEIVAEAGRSASLKTMLEAYDQALCSAIQAKLDAQKRAGAVPENLDIALAGSCLSILVDGLVSRQMVVPPKAYDRAIRAFGVMVAKSLT
jgi:TetR/AcrR family transcriptional regulator, repressor for uid operon